MQDAYRYFPVTPAQAAWGLYVTCAGHHVVRPGDIFPSPEHPDEYYFTWERGRTLNEWQLILLEAGEGRVEFRDGAFAAAPGSLIVLPPGCWHRYRPNPQTGWTTHWVGFGGDLADRLVGGAKLGPDGAVRDFSANSALRQAFAAATADLLASAERHPFAAAAQVTALVAAFAESAAATAAHATDGWVFRAQREINERLSESVDFEALARSLGLTYRAFRYLFRREVGQSPLQYQLARRLVRAKNLLASSDLPVREIAETLGFRSTWYFSHFFRKHVRQSPAAYRKGRRHADGPAPAAASR